MSNKKVVKSDREMSEAELIADEKAKIIRIIIDCDPKSLKELSLVVVDSGDTIYRRSVERL